MIGQRVSAAVVVMLSLLPGVGFGATWWVDQAAKPGGDGSADRPFVMISQAIKAAAGGDVISVRAGVYHESLMLDKSGTADHPTTLRAADGQRVILSGFTPVTGWQRDPQHDGVYVTTVDGGVEDLFVGYVMQAVSRWPAADRPWRHIGQCDAAAHTITDVAAMGDDAKLSAIAANPAAARVYLYASRGNFFRDAAVTAFDLAKGVMHLPDGSRLEAFTSKGCRYHITNHVALIDGPGQWAVAPVDAHHTRIYFRPADASDLQHTQIRRTDRALLRIGPWRGTASHFRIEGLELTGGLDKGIDIERAEHVTVTHCIVHQNAGAGISTRRAAYLTFTNNISLANGSGVTVASGHDVLIEHNEIAYNMVDGMDIAGNITGRPGGEPTTHDVTIRANYIHHHLLLAHPDNVQTYRDVDGFHLIDNVMLLGGQGLMTEQTNHGSLDNCVVFGTAAIAVIFGHANANDWSVHACTIGFGGWGALSLTGQRYQLDHNIYIDNPTPLGPTVTSDHNLFVTNTSHDAIAIVSKPKWKSFDTIAAVAAATGQEAHSVIGDPHFRHAPSRQAISLWSDDNTLGRLFVRQNGVRNPTEGFAVGDHIEINGDGVLRRLTAVDDKSITFDPPLKQLPLRSSLIWNWKDAHDTTLDLRPAPGTPATPGSTSTSAGGVGSTLDIPAYQRGDFDGDGHRDLPPLPADVQAGRPDPNAIVLPLHGA